RRGGDRLRPPRRGPPALAVGARAARPRPRRGRPRGEDPVVRPADAGQVDGDRPGHGDVGARHRRRRRPRHPGRFRSRLRRGAAPRRPDRIPDPRLRVFDERPRAAELRGAGRAHRPGRGRPRVRAGGRRRAGHGPAAGLLPARHAAGPPRGHRAGGHGGGRRRLAAHRPGIRRNARWRPGEGSAGMSDRDTSTRQRAARATAPALRVGNMSGFYGDRITAMREMLEGAELDVLTGDYLAELTMLILGRDRMKNPDGGFAKTFLRQLDDCLGLALDSGVRIVANAGGLNPAGLATAISELGERHGLAPRVAHVEGDDLISRIGELDVPADAGQPVTANAYLGAFGIAACLDAGADVVVTGRVTDASVIVGPAISHFGWDRDDLDALAGATAAGHVIECGTQATGGNYAFFTRGEIADPVRPGFPIAEIAADGSSVITKHPGSGGAVTVGTVTSQLLYEVTGARYGGPDVITRLDTAVLDREGPDRVRISGVRGEPAPPSTKVSVTCLGGFRNQVTF